MGRHDGVDFALLEQIAVGDQLILAPRVGHIDEAQVRVALRTAVAGKVLERALDAFVVVTVDIGAGLGGDDRRIGGEAAPEAGNNRVVEDWSRTSTTGARLSVMPPSASICAIPAATERVSSRLLSCA